MEEEKIIDTQNEQDVEELKLYQAGEIEEEV